MVFQIGGMADQQIVLMPGRLLFISLQIDYMNRVQFITAFGREVQNSDVHTRLCIIFVALVDIHQRDLTVWGGIIRRQNKKLHRKTSQYDALYKKYYNKARNKVQEKYAPSTVRQRISANANGKTLGAWNSGQIKFIVSRCKYNV